MAIFLICLIIFLLYGRTILYKLVVDDIARYMQLAEPGRNFKLGSWKRPLTYIAQQLYGAGTFGPNPAIDHAFTIAHHTLNCVLMYFVFGHNAVALGAALLYAVNPINHQTAIWLNGRRYAINITLVLLMLLIPKPWGLIAWGLTPLFQVSALFAPVLLGPWYLLLIPAALVLGYPQWKVKYDARLITITNDDQREFTPKRLIVSIKMFGFYFLRMIVPGQVFMIYPNLYFWGMTPKGNQNAYALNREFLSGVISLLLVITGALFLPSQERVYLLFIVLSLSLWCSLYQCVTQHSTDRYCSLANVFMSYLVSFVAFGYMGVWAIPGLAVLFGYYVAQLNITMPMYRDIHHFHLYHNYFHPSNQPSHYAMAQGFLASKNGLSAWEHCQNGLKHNPTDFKLNLAACQISIAMGDKEMARRYYQIAIDNIYFGHEESYKGVLADIKQTLDKPMVYQPARSAASVYVPNREERRKLKVPAAQAPDKEFQLIS